LAEVPELRPAARRRRCDDGGRLAPVCLEADLRARDAPVDEALDGVLACGEEVIDEREVGLGEPLAHEEALRADLRKALVTASRRRVRAELPVPRTDELADVVTDRQVLVQRVHDRRVGQRVAYHADRVEADEERVLEMDDVGTVREKEVPEIAGQCFLTR
jgi:hypothetical protein